jgi:tRNA-(ms[2]io[6]A)-hydroxylase
MSSSTGRRATHSYNARRCRPSRWSAPAYHAYEYDEFAMFSDLNEFLGCSTPDAWVVAALANQDVMLIDHGNCEKKAAGTAFQLMFRYVDKPDLQNKMSRLAREELRHFEQVLAILRRRGIPQRNVSSSRYAAGLRELVRNHEPFRLTDTLVIGAFIEARSCERFARLVPHLDEELGKFYHGLLKSEARHFQDYLKLAYQYGEAADVDATILRVRERERELVESADCEFRFHSGVPQAA